MTVGNEKASQLPTNPGYAGSRRKSSHCIGGDVCRPRQVSSTELRRRVWEKVRRDSGVEIKDARPVRG